MPVLDGVLVIDLSRHIAGPYCTQLMGDMGARVIKVESPRGDDSRAEEPIHDGFSLYFSSFNRNKESIAIDMRSTDGKQLLSALIEKADILVQNYKPGVMDQMGFSTEHIHKLNKRVVYLSISGFGTKGAYGGLPAFDEVIQAFTGLMDLTGQLDGPPTLIGVPILDVLTGAYAFGVAMLGLIQRDATGAGTDVAVDLYGAGLQPVGTSLAMTFATGRAETRAGNRNRYAAGINAYQTIDGWVELVGYSDAHWSKMADRIGGQALANDPRYATLELRQAALDEVDRLVAGWMQNQTTEAVIAWMAEDGVPCGPVRTMTDVSQDPELVENSRIVEVRHPKGYPIKVVGSPFEVPSAAATVRLPPPLIGQHSVSIATGLLGLDGSAVKDLLDQGVLFEESLFSVQGSEHR